MDTKLLNKQWFLTLLILPFFKLPVFELINGLKMLDTFFDLYRLVSFAVIIFLYIKKRQMSSIVLAICAYQFSLFVSTFINGGNYWKLAVNCGTVIAFAMITELAVKNNGRMYFKAVIDIYLPLTILNLIVIILYPSGIAREDYYGNIYYLIGIRNGFPAILIPLMTYGFVYSAYSNKRFTLKTFVLTAVSAASIFITWSATGVAGCFLLLVMCIFIYRTKIASFFNSLLLEIVCAAAFFAIVIFRVQYYFSFVIEGLLHRSISFTGRTDIWNISMELIKRSPIVGYGVYEGHGLIYYRGIYYYSHNAFLEVMLQGGAIALIFFMLIWVLSAVNLYRSRKTEFVPAVVFGIFSVHLMLLMEAYIDSIWIYSLAVIACCVRDISGQMSGEVSPAVHPNLSLRSRYIIRRLSRDRRRRL